MKPIPSPSPNYAERRGPGIDMIVLHYTGMATAESARAWLCDETSKVSSHYLVDEGGQVFALVGEDKRAWHAGVSHWAGISDINSCSIGIEIHNPGHEGGLPDYPDAQIKAVIELCAGIIERHQIARRRVLAHSDVAPGRKIDPGEHFPWARLARAGIGLWADPAAPDEAAVLALGAEGEEVNTLQNRFKKIGYNIEKKGIFDEMTQAVASAFQRHWRPVLVDGRADASTRDALARIIEMASAD